MELGFWLGASRKTRRQTLRHFLRRRYSANLVIDVQNTCMYPPSLVGTAGSGAVVGTVCDMLGADTYTNVWVVAGGGSSGILSILVQTASVTSGQLSSGSAGAIVGSGAFTDPTSGLAQLPTTFGSGTVLYLNSGLYSLPGGGGASGAMSVNTFGAGTNPVFNGQVPAGGAFSVSGSFPVFGSGGGMAWAAFQRPADARYCRIIMLSGSYGGAVTAGFLGNKRTTGSGGGFTHSPALDPSIGPVNV